MSRPIKFKIWDVVNKKMILEPKINFVEPDSFYWLEAHRAAVRSDMEAELMQFTGLYDKNGKDVYEGDIVKFSGDDHVRTAEEADRPIQKITWGSRGWNAPASLEARWEVIGNIYENKELLQ